MPIWRTARVSWARSDGDRRSTLPARRHLFEDAEKLDVHGPQTHPAFHVGPGHAAVRRVLVLDEFCDPRLRLRDLGEHRLHFALALHPGSKLLDEPASFSIRSSTMERLATDDSMTSRTPSM